MRKAITVDVVQNLNDLLEKVTGDRFAARTVVVDQVKQLTLGCVLESEHWALRDLLTRIYEMGLGNADDIWVLELFKDV